MTARTATPSQHSRRSLLLAAGASLVLAPRHARAALTPADRPAVARVETYLNSIRTLVSRFDQVSGDGGTASGIIYLQRPGHMRIVYDKPNPIVIVATQGKVYYYDGKLDQVSFVDLDDTPAWFLLQEDVHLSGDVMVENLQNSPGAIRMTVTETKRAARGRVTLTFSDDPLQLRQWTIVDAQNKVVTVTLSDPHFGGSIDQRLFIWFDPHSSAGGG